MKVVVTPIVSDAYGTVAKGLVNGRRLEKMWQSEDHPDYSIIKILKSKILSSYFVILLIWSKCKGQRRIWV